MLMLLVSLTAFSVSTEPAFADLNSVRLERNNILFIVSPNLKQLQFN